MTPAERALLTVLPADSVGITVRRLGYDAGLSDAHALKGLRALVRAGLAIRTAGAGEYPHARYAKVPTTRRERAMNHPITTPAYREPAVGPSPPRTTLVR